MERSPSDPERDESAEVVELHRILRTRISQTLPGLATLLYYEERATRIIQASSVELLAFSDTILGNLRQNWK